MIYTFGSIQLDLSKVELRDNGELRPVEPQVFALIAYLAEHRGRMVSKDELFEKLWEGKVVSDSALATRVKSARRALGDDGRTQAMIKTVHGQGLRFVAHHCRRPAARIDHGVGEATLAVCRCARLLLPFPG